MTQTVTQLDAAAMAAIMGGTPSGVHATGLTEQDALALLHGYDAGDGGDGGE